MFRYHAQSTGKAWIAQQITFAIMSVHDLREPTISLVGRARLAGGGIRQRTGNLFVVGQFQHAVDFKRDGDALCHLCVSAMGDRHAAAV